MIMVVIITTRTIVMNNVVKNIFCATSLIMPCVVSHLLWFLFFLFFSSLFLILWSVSYNSHIMCNVWMWCNFIFCLRFSFVLFFFAVFDSDVSSIKISNTGVPSRKL